LCDRKTNEAFLALIVTDWQMLNSIIESSPNWTVHVGTAGINLFVPLSKVRRQYFDFQDTFCKTGTPNFMKIQQTV